MKNKSLLVSDIVAIVKDYYRGKKAILICGELGIERITLDRWLTEFGPVANELLNLGVENERLRERYTNVSLINEALHDELEKLSNIK